VETHANRMATQVSGCEPIAYHMRDAFPGRWVRFHSLPGSKRYPEDAAEYATVLERHNVILGELVRPGATVVLLTTGYSDSPAPIRSDVELMTLDPDASHWRTVAMHEVDASFGGSSHFHVYASKRQWHPGAFDPLVMLIADDVIANVMIVAPDCRWLLQPYDGGMDVIAESSAGRDRLKDSDSGWLSTSPGGL
jgi:hypothetical protein